MNLSLSFSTVVLYVRIMKVRDFLPKISPKNQLNVYFVSFWQHRLGIAKLKNVFGSFLTL